jgi:hypothetical protein
MMLARKVARLMSGDDHYGSAWLICGEYALTALHCVQSADGEIRSPLSLVFPSESSQVEVQVEVIESEARIDVALLKLKTPLDDLNNVIDLSRSTVTKEDTITLHGHPAAASASPQGTSIFCKVVDPIHPYVGVKGKLKLNTLKMHSETTSPSFFGGQQTSGLEGASGGVVSIRAEADSEFAVGLLIEDSLSGNELHAVPISEIAKSFKPVMAALERSLHVDTRLPRIYIRLTSTGRIQWSGSISPSDVGQLWDVSVAEQGQLKISIEAKLSDLGSADDALLRLSAYANLRALQVPDQNNWNGKLKQLKDAHREPDIAVKFVAGPEEKDCPAAWLEFNECELAGLIHSALDRKILNWLNDELYSCLRTKEDTEIGENIEESLANLMWVRWKIWHIALQGDALLLQHFLSRIFDLDAKAVVTQSNFASIGFCIPVRKQLLRATLFGLALDAAGVTTTPQARDVGNLVVDEQSGHACGISKRNRLDLRRFANSIDWKSDVVFLPYLETSLIELYERSIPMISTEGTKGHLITQAFPIALTAEDAFLDALKSGAQRVHEFYLKLKDERDLRLVALKLPARTESLNV